MTAFVYFSFVAAVLTVAGLIMLPFDRDGAACIGCSAIGALMLAIFTRPRWLGGQ